MINLKSVGLSVLKCTIMTYQDKTKEKLIKELQELQQENSSLKAGYDKDITELKQTEKSLTQELYLMNALMKNLPDHIYFKDIESRFIRINDAHAQSFGLSTPGEVIGKTDFDFFTEEHARQAYNDEQAIIQSGKPLIKEEKQTWTDRSDTWVSTIKIPLLNYEGNIVGTFGISRDITEQKNLTIDLIKAKEHAEESDRLKSAFLANMSHEIRTPMNGILGFAELLKEPDLTGEKQQNYIKIIERSGARMLNIINDIIDISKIESGLMEVSIKDTNINEQIEFIYTFFKPEVEAKGMQLSFKNSLPTKEAIIKTDREKIYAILTNLVKNAIKYSNKGIIEFGYEFKVKSGTHLKFFVKDTGIGIPKDRQEAVFHRFVQADIGDKRAYQGAGLGLSISEAYVEMLGGKIWVESEQGKGSKFYFTIPYSTEPKEIITIKNVNSLHEEENQIKNLKILIAEDDDISEMIITMIVKIFGKEILRVRNGVEAVEVCRNNPDIDLIMMDIQMPEMNGHEAARQIRQFNKTVVIIAQTAYGLIGDREIALEAGCNDYISKPISHVLLKQIIEKHFNSSLRKN